VYGQFRRRLDGPAGEQLPVDTEDVELKPQIVMSDNDGNFTEQFDDVLKATNADIKRNTVRVPNLRPHV
jgi:hypothetical protein